MYSSKIHWIEPCIMVHICNPSTWEAETERLQSIGGKARYQDSIKNKEYTKPRIKFTCKLQT